MKILQFFVAFLEIMNFTKIGIKIFTTHGPGMSACVSLFFGRSFDSTILFWDLLTFKQKLINVVSDQWERP